MASLQKALPPELADNVLRLYRECLRRAKFIGHQQHNTELLISMVRQQFKKNMHETDPEKIQKMKDDAARGLINHMLFESEKMSGRKFSVNNLKMQDKINGNVSKRPNDGERTLPFCWHPVQKFSSSSVSSPVKAIRILVPTHRCRGNHWANAMPSKVEIMAAVEEGMWL
ncbi:hypothetical protein GUJ93_ZPchr0012g21759 [Zizania palustris]|uniref:Complex 1 LYR protein domain-containing protein n=1 Tax=Zizania palustris TaxID=103762 RepID=A0A8J6BTM8_ZIZPA|nr:hypothetical protein GUJ93_ZPchr0012g21759 [Zizania palustris]